MAKIQFSPLVSSVSGRFQGGVFGSWQGVNLFRKFTKPANPKTTAQVNHRNAFRNLLRFFGTLPAVTITGATKAMTDAWRDAWKRRARQQPGQARNFFLGEFLKGAAATLYGKRWFGGATSVAPPTITATLTGAKINVTVTNVASAPSGYVLNGVMAAAIKEGQTLTSETTPVADYHAAGNQSGTAFDVGTGLTVGDSYEIHAAAVFVKTGADATPSTITISGEAILTGQVIAT